MTAGADGDATCFVTTSSTWTNTFVPGADHEITRCAAGMESGSAITVMAQARFPCRHGRSPDHRRRFRDGIDAESLFHGQRHFDDHFTGARCDDRRADEFSLATRGQLDKSIVFAVALRAICVRDGCLMNMNRVAQMLARLRFRQSDACHLRIGEGDGRQHVRPRRGLAGQQGITHGAKALPSGEMRELLSSDDIAA